MQSGRPGLELVLRPPAARHEHALERGRPALVVGAVRRCDLLDQRRAKPLVVERTRLVQRYRDAERAALPRRLEDELAVGPRRPVGAGDHPVPTMLSRVTSAASLSSEAPSV